MCTHISHWLKACRRTALVFFRRTTKMAALMRICAAFVLLTFGASAAGGSSVCDTANCGKGNCTETPPPALIPYKCECDPGWSQAIKLIPMSPCTIPNCTFNSACLNQSLAPPGGTPPVTDICAAVNCGPGGACRKGDGGVFSYSCECRPGYANLLNLSTLPCVNNCFFGNDCSALGLAPQPPSPAPSGGDHDPPKPTPPPSGGTDNATTSSGSAPSKSLRQLLLLLTAAAVVQAV